MEQGRKKDLLPWARVEERCSQGLTLQQWSLRGHAWIRLVGALLCCTLSQVNALDVACLRSSPPQPVRRQLWSGRLSGVYWLLSWLPRWLQERIMNLRMHLAPVRPPHVKAD